MRTLLIAVIGLAACTDDDVIVPQTVQRACAEVSASQVDFAVDLRPATGDCFGDVEATCSVTTTSYTLLTISTELRGTPISACTRQGKLYTAHCSTGLVADITHRIEVGDLAMTLDVPSAYSEPLCVRP